MTKLAGETARMGEFGEALVTYALIRKNFMVLDADHEGFDLIAAREGENQRYGVSVKTRLIHETSPESRVFTIDHSHLDRLIECAKPFDLVPVFAQVVCLAKDHTVEVFMMLAKSIPELLPEGKNGYQLGLGPRDRPKIMELASNHKIEYSCWKQEEIGTLDFIPE